MHQKHTIQGVTLLEIMLVLAIASSILIMAFNFVQQKTQEIRLNHTALQLQQLQNAALSYFAVTNRWPANLEELQDKGFLPKSQTLQNPWGNSFFIKASADGKAFYVDTDVSTATNAQIIAGKLPLGFVSDAAGVEQSPPTSGVCGTALEAGCVYAVSMSSVPQKNLDNASDLTFANLYHSGACVPEPLCPIGKDGGRMQAEIIVMPVKVQGIFPQTTPTGVVPISGYTARAIPARRIEQGNLPACHGGGAPCEQSSGVPMRTTGRYWRVCLSVTADEGSVLGAVRPPTIAAGRETGVVLAVTRCKPATENSGTDFNVWSN